MFRKLLFIILFASFSNASVCQTTQIIDKEIGLIRNIPQTKITKRRTFYSKGDKHYKAIIKLDTAAIPVLIGLITDKTQTPVIDICSGENLTIGDIAYSIVAHIIPIPYHIVFGGQWDVITDCGPDGQGSWSFINDQGTLVKAKLEKFYQSETGKKWMILIKSKKLSKAEYDSLIKELFNSYK